MATDTHPTTDREVTVSTSTTTVVCPCGCGDTVALEFTGGFAGTTCALAACPARQAAGMVSTTIRRSAALELEAPASTPAGVRHHDGLVALLG